jgi:PPOX class probable F420-dependent enzyme
VTGGGPGQAGARVPGRRERLGRERYVNLATFRRSGHEVQTPVWVAPDGDRLVVYTNAKSGKVKRIRNDGRVRLAPCDARGRLRGEWVEARARLRSDPAEMERGLAAIRRKYGWQMDLLRLGARLSGRWAERAVIEIDVQAAP